MLDDPAYKPTQTSARLVAELIRRFGKWEAVPATFQEAAWLIHMRLVESERDIDYLLGRLDGKPDEDLKPPSIAGEETGEF